MSRPGPDEPRPRPTAEGAPGDETAHPEPAPARSDGPATYMPKPPTPAERDRVSEAQALITDEWTGDAPEGTPAGRE